MNGNKLARYGSLKWVGEVPVQRLKARVKLLVSVKPSRKVISVTERVRCRYDF